MKDFLNILGFVSPLLWKYRSRFIIGFFLSLGFGLFNGTLVGTTQFVAGRLGGDSGRGIFQFPEWLSDWNWIGENVWWGFDQIFPLMGSDLTTLNFLGGLLFFSGLLAIRGGLNYTSRYCLYWVSERIVHDLRCECLEKLYSLSLNYFNWSKTGDLHTKVQGDTDRVQHFSGSGICDLIKEPVTIIAVVSALLMVSWKLTLIGFVFLPACLIPIIVLGKKMKKAAERSLFRKVDQSNMLIESLKGMRLVKAFGLEKKQRARFETLSRDVVHHNMKMVQSRELINPVIETISGLSVGVLIVYVAWEGIAIKDWSAFLAGMLLIYNPIKKLSRLHLLIKETSVAVDRLAQLRREEAQVDEMSGEVALEGFQREICFHEVSFQYEEREVLSSINLKVKRGARLGIAGESGSGKSTLLDLLFRFYDPVKGSISIDGVDYGKLKVGDLRKQMALVSQDVILFDMSVGENIALGGGDVSEMQIMEAAKQAGAHDFITQMENGYDTLIGESGVRLSGGQRQRLALARAFIRNAPILILDEATAALDSKSEAVIQEVIERLSQEKTVIAVAHRLATLSRMDEVVVLDGGRIIEHGGYEELLKQGGAFTSLARKQGLCE